MIRIWIYERLEKYYKFCYHKWLDIYIQNRANQSLLWVRHYEHKLRKTHMRKEAYKYYISLRHM